MSEYTKNIKVDLLTRVEGEGRFWLKVKDGTVADSALSIFEAPRYFEALLRGRSLHEVTDIVARICGICPVAYQVSASHALENAQGINVSRDIWALRRLLYCGEWIQSHALHVFMLHAPDYLGYPSAVEMAADHKEIVEKGLRLRQIGNTVMELLGGRAVHPISMRVGGFWKTPTVQDLQRIRGKLTEGIDDVEEMIDWAASLPIPDFEQDYVCVALDAGSDYPIEWGKKLAISDRGTIAVEEFEEHFEEHHVPHSNALQCRLKDGTPYLVGPLARINLHADRLHPRAQRALGRSGLRLPVRNPYQSIIVRSIETLHAFAEAIDLIDAYSIIDPPYYEVPPRAGRGVGVTEAPRGICWHRYDVNADGTIAEARIVPPTSQNQAQIEADLVGLAPLILDMKNEEATLYCEQLIRAYDPCISCATHFLKLDIEHITTTP